MDLRSGSAQISTTRNSDLYFLSAQASSPYEMVADAGGRERREMHARPDRVYIPDIAYVTFKSYDKVCLQSPVCALSACASPTQPHPPTVCLYSRRISWSSMQLADRVVPLRSLHDKSPHLPPLERRFSSNPGRTPLRISCSPAPCAPSGAPAPRRATHRVHRHVRTMKVSPANKPWHGTK